MENVWIIVAGFLACSLLIIFSGSKLSKYGDIIADLSGMGKAWFGLIMMGAVTSLPELFTGISAVSIFDSPDIAVGDIMGSCAFNLLILAVLDYFVPGRPISSAVTKGHLLAGFSGIVLLTVVVFTIVFRNMIPAIGWLSSSSLLLIFLYLVAIRLIFKSEQREHASVKGVETVSPTHSGITLKTAIRFYVLYALMVIAGAIALPYFADHLAAQAGISKSFVGTLLVAATTSLPELVVSIAAVRMGSIDMAVGNLLGSNIFNMAILAIDDFLYRKGPLLNAVDPSHALSAMAAIVMTAIAGIGIMYGSPTKRFSLGIDAIVLVLVYTSLLVVLYQMT